MATTAEPTMGRFSIEVELANLADVLGATNGQLSPEKVRRAIVRGVVDTGATRLVLPESVVNQLGLEIAGTIKVNYADSRTAERAIVRYVQLKYRGREGAFSATVEPDRQTALIGAIVLEDLDFVVDCTAGRLVPRDPKQVVSEEE
jgi:predicted aspartyl protease